eukprot:gene100-184_t
MSQLQCQRRSIAVVPQTHTSKQVSPVLKQLKTVRPRAAQNRTEAERELLTRQLHDKIWNCICQNQDWDTWEQTFAEFREQDLQYTEVTYTLLLHGFLLSHRHRSENAFLVLEEMKQCRFIPGALIRLNEGMLNSYFELLELDARPPPQLWQNVTRLCYHSALRYRKKRMQQLRAELAELPGDDVLRLTPADVQQRFLVGGDRREASMRYLGPSESELQTLRAMGAVEEEGCATWGMHDPVDARPGVALEDFGDENLPSAAVGEGFLGSSTAVRGAGPGEAPSQSLDDIVSSMNFRDGKFSASGSASGRGEKGGAPIGDRLFDDDDEMDEERYLED